MFVEGDTLMEGSSKDFWEILPKFALQYQFSPTAHIYLSASKGYKTGGYNEQAFSKLLQNALAASIMRNAMSGMPGGGGAPGGTPGGSTADEPTSRSSSPTTPKGAGPMSLADATRCLTTGSR